MVGGQTNARFRSIRRERARAGKRNWTSVSLCDLTQASRFVGAATPLLQVCELGPLSRFWSEVCHLASPAHAHVCRDCENVCASLCVHMWETGHRIVPGKRRLAYARATGHTECNSRRQRQLEWEALRPCPALGPPEGNPNGPSNSNTTTSVGADLRAPADGWGH